MLSQPLQLAPYGAQNLNGGFIQTSLLFCAPLHIMLLSPCLMGNGEVIWEFQTHYWDIARLPSFIFYIHIFGNQLGLEEVAGDSVKFLPPVQISPFKLIACFFINKTFEIGWNLRCKNFGLKIQRCKILDKPHVCRKDHFESWIVCKTI